MREAHDGDEHPEHNADNHGVHREFQRDDEPFENEAIREVVKNRIPAKSPSHDGVTGFYSRDLVTGRDARRNLGENGMDKHGDEQRQECQANPLSDMANGDDLDCSAPVRIHEVSFYYDLRQSPVENDL